MKLIKKLDLRYATESSKRKTRYGLFLCDVCKTSCEVAVGGGTKSKSCRECAAISLDKRNTTHGGAGSRMYRTWQSMRRRSNNKNREDYKCYGGRGIKICEEWNDFSVFRDWAMANGYADDLSIDRIDNDKGYSPDNCRFTSKEIQARNTRRICSNNTSGYRGVSWRKDTNKWRAEITVNSKRINLGSFVKAPDAAKAYDQYIIDNNLEHTTNGVITGE